MTRGACNLPLLGSVERSLGRHAGAQAVPGNQGRVDPGARGGALQNLGDGSGRQGMSGDVSVPVHGPKHRPGGDDGCFEPAAERADRAGFGMLAQGHGDTPALLFLIGLGSPQPYIEATVGEGEVPDFEDRGKLASPESAREPHQDESAVAQTEEIIRRGGNDSANVAGEEWSASLLGRSERAMDAGQNLADEIVLARRGGGIGVTRLTVGAGDRGHAPADGRDGEAGGEIGHVEDDRLRR